MSCNKKKQVQEFAKELHFDEKLYANLIECRFKSECDTFNICHSNFIYFDTLHYFYSKNKYKAIFTSTITQLQKSDSIAVELSNSLLHGLNNNYYLLAFIKENLKQINKNLEQKKINYSLNARTELLLANACIAYNKDLGLGRINPKKIFKENYFLPLKNDSLFNLFEPLTNENTLAIFEKNKLKDKDYQALQKQLTYYDSLSKKASFEIIPDSIAKIVLWDSIAFIDKIAKRLLITNYISKQNYSTCSKVYYDSILFQSVVKYQTDNGLLNDGVIGKNTINALNESFNHIANKIAINMDRLRWLENNNNAKKIIVNIPNYTLTASDSGKVFLQMKVCVGEKKDKNYDAKLKHYLKTKKPLDKPLNHETPNLFGQLSHLILNPTWSVPRNIAEREIYFSVLKDSTYLQSKNFLVYRDDSLINPLTINWRNYQPDKIPFRFVQDAGDGNALGKMKFIFSNRFNVYLHDTPSQSAFNRANRAVSHGCVRVSKPIDLAYFLLKDNKRFGPDEYRMQLGMLPLDEKKLKDYEKKLKKEKQLFELDPSLKEKKEEDMKKTKTILFDRKTQLFIDYKTAWVDEQNQLQLRDDVYNKDKEIEKYFYKN